MLNLIGKRYLYFIISAIVIIPGIISLLIPPGLQLGVDFTGGTLYEMQFTRSVQPADVKSIFTEAGLPEAVPRVKRKLNSCKSPSNAIFRSTGFKITGSNRDLAQGLHPRWLGMTKATGSLDNHGFDSGIPWKPGAGGCSRLAARTQGVTVGLSPGKF